MTSRVKRIVTGVVLGAALVGGVGVVARAVATSGGQPEVKEISVPPPGASREARSAKPSLPPGQVPPGQEGRRDELLSHFLTNDKGQHYGKMADGAEIGVMPDLIQARATNGRVGYILVNDLDAAGYSQDPVRIPVYDVNMEKVLGEYVSGGGSEP
ncbi:hypothetical protein SAMN05421595_3101 [Austwickia chelonae]|uniref:Uncharacterized protein n=1 Tax=Austwickia chelonae NBRC 105200 TaxID=1184607 RepID=K6WBZ8_9MICO|nr:hypothetical protein [Austwickia chelonae]GAB79357.1 hypothetical protein AUCHE_24_00100 [Austwickia chelonae NBRC 105200]SEW43935.1 hypothetical protein SAMN05421595_3101 [Austwickia chelonae]